MSKVAREGGGNVLMGGKGTSSLRRDRRAMHLPPLFFSLSDEIGKVRSSCMLLPPAECCIPTRVYPFCKGTCTHACRTIKKASCELVCSAVVFAAPRLFAVRNEETN